MINRILMLAVLSFAGSAAHAANTLLPTSDASHVQFNWGVKITLRDGIRLNATVYLPKDQSAPAPCVFTLTPYVSDTYHARGIYFAAHGFPFAIVDVRGRGNSEGIFHPMIQEAHDGYDVVEWLARQPFCNGKVTMWGGSYAGYDQWATAKELPPHLATIVPVASPYAGVDFPMRSNILYPYVVQWLTYTSGHTLQEQIFGDDGFWSAIFRRWYESGRSFGDLDSVLGNALPTFHEWVSHPEPDAYWDAYNPTAEQYAKLSIPILTITASYDDDQPGALEHYKRYMEAASPESRARHFLVIGPWDHAGTRTPRDVVGGVKFGPASLVDLPKLHLEWYRWTMAGGQKPAFLRAPVTYYVMGAEEWRYAESLDAVTAKRKDYMLDSNGRADDPYRSGFLGESPAKGPPDSYRYDPRDVKGPEVAALERVSGGDHTDQTILNAMSGRELIYQTAPFAVDTEVSGFFKLSAWISIDTPDTDLYVSVHRIAPDGSSVLLATDALRARYREGPRSPKLIRTREPLRYDFEHFTFVSRQIKQGERLRLVIAPIGGIIEASFDQKNYQGGGVVAEETAHEARAVTVKLLHDRTHPSTLSVPLGRPVSANEVSVPPEYFTTKPGS